MARRNRQSRMVATPHEVLFGWQRRSRAGLLRSTALQAAAWAVLALPASAQLAPSARPTGGQVSGGLATIGGNASTTLITQRSQNAAINWQSYNIGSAQTVQYVQPNATSVALNRVIGPDPSQIAGHLLANGQVIIVNQSGVVFAHGAQVDTGGLVATTAGISDQNFMAGHMVFDQAGRAGAMVSNAGNITVRQAGLAALVAPQVANSGTITAQLGRVVLGGAVTHTLDLYGDGLVALNITGQVSQASLGGHTVPALITNTGAILAPGGTVVLSASAVDGVVTTLVSAGGTVATPSVGAQTGRVLIQGVGGGVEIDGLVSATGSAPGTLGGQVEVNASGAVTVAPSAVVDASGDGGGGLVAIGTTAARAAGGGSVQATLTAASTTIAAGAVLRANAVTRGGGGRVAVLSGGRTTHAGAIAARGGTAAGDGGAVEIGGATLALDGTIDAGAPAGGLGSLLLAVAGTIHVADSKPTNCPVASCLTYAQVEGQPYIGTLTTTNAGDIDLLFTRGDSVLGSNLLSLRGGTSGTGGIGVNFLAAQDINIDSGVTVSAASITLAAARSVNLASTVGGGGATTLSLLETLGGDSLGGAVVVTATTGAITTGDITALPGNADVVLTATLDITDRPAGSGPAPRGTVDVFALAAVSATGQVDFENPLNQVSTLLGSSAGTNFILRDGTVLTVSGLATATNTLTLVAPTIDVSQGGNREQSLGLKADTIVLQANAFNLVDPVVATTLVAIDRLKTGTLTVGGGGNITGLAEIFAPTLVLGSLNGLNGDPATSGIDIAENINVQSALGLFADGTIIETRGAVIVAASLFGGMQSTVTGAAVTLTDDNAVTDLGPFAVAAAAQFSFTDAVNLTVTGAVVVGGDVIISTVATGGGQGGPRPAPGLTVGRAGQGSVSGLDVTLTAAGGLTLDGAVTATAGTLALGASAITEGSGGLLTGGILVATSAGSIALGGANAVATIGSGVMGLTAGAGDIVFDDTVALTVARAISAPKGAVTIADGILGSPVLLTAGADITGTTVSLTSSGRFVQTASTTIEASSGALTVTADSGDLAFAGTLQAGTLSNGFYTQVAALTATSGDIVEGGGRLLAGALTGSATQVAGAGAGGSATFAGPGNTLSVLGSFHTDQSFVLEDDSGLAVTGPVSAGGAIDIHDPASGSTAGILALDADIMAGGTISLTNAAGIEQFGGTVHAGLNPGLLGGLTLRTGGAILQQAGDSVGAAILQSDTGPVILSAGGSTNFSDGAPTAGIAFAGTIMAGTFSTALGSATGTASLLAANGDVTETVGTGDPKGIVLADALMVQAGTLGGATAWNVALDTAAHGVAGGNQVRILLGGAAANRTSFATGGFSFTDNGFGLLTDPGRGFLAQNIQLEGGAAAFGGNLTIHAQNAWAILDNNPQAIASYVGTLQALNGLLTINADLGIVQAAGSILANAVSLDAGYCIAQSGIASIDATTSASLEAHGNGVVISGGNSATIYGLALTGTIGADTLSLIADAGDLAQSTPVFAGAHGTLVTRVLSGAAQAYVDATGVDRSAVTLDTASSPTTGNQIATLANFAADGNFTLVDGEALTVTGALDAARVIAPIPGLAAISLHMPGLTVDAGARIDLGAAGLISLVADRFRIASAVGSVPAGLVFTTGGTIALDLLHTGIFTVDSTATATIDAASLAALATMNGTIALGTLDGVSANPAAAFTAAAWNASSAGSVSALDINLAVDFGPGGAPIQASALGLFSDGTIASTVGLTVGTLYGAAGLSTAGGKLALVATADATAVIDGANAITTMGSFLVAGAPVADANAAFTLTDTVPLTVAGPLQTSSFAGLAVGGAVSIAVTGVADPLTLAGAITGTDVVLTADGAIVQAAGSMLTAAGAPSSTLVLQSARGDIALGGASIAGTLGTSGRYSGALLLAAAGSIVESAGGSLAVGSLAARAGGGIALTSLGNTIGVVGNFTYGGPLLATPFTLDGLSAAGTGGIALTDATSLLVADDVSGRPTIDAEAIFGGSTGTGDVTLVLTTPGTSLQLGTGPGTTVRALGDVTLTSAGSIVQDGGLVAGGYGVGIRAAGDVTSRGGTIVSTGLAGESGSGTVAVYAGHSLFSGGTIQGGMPGAGNVYSGAVLLDAATGDILQSAGSVRAGTLAAAAFGSIALALDSNAIGTVAALGYAYPIAAGGLPGTLALLGLTANAGIVLHDAASLTIADLALVEALQGSIAIDVTDVSRASAPSLTLGSLAGAVVSAMGSVALSADGAFLQNGGVVDAGAGSVTIAARGGELAFNGTIAGGGASDASGVFTAAPGSAVSLSASGDITDAVLGNSHFGRILAGTLSAAAGGRIALSDSPAANQVGTVERMAASGNIDFVDAVNLALSGDVRSSGGSIALAALGITQTGGTIAAGLQGVFLTAGSSGLTQGSAGSIISAADATLVSSAGVQLGGTIETERGLAITAANQIRETSGFISTGTLAAQAGGSLLLESPGSIASIGTVGTLSGLSASGIAVVDSGALAVNSSVTAKSGDVNLQAGGDLTQAVGTAISATGNVDLSSSAAINIGGVVQSSAGDVNLRAVGDLTQAVGTVILATGTVDLFSSAAITIDGMVQSSAGDMMLQGTGGISEASTGRMSANDTMRLLSPATITIGGALAAPTIQIDAASKVTFNGGTVATAGDFGRLPIGIGQPLTNPHDGLFINAANFSQTGLTTLASLNGGQTLQITLAGTGVASFQNLVAKQTQLLLVLQGGGSAHGLIDVAGLNVFYNNPPQTTTSLTGTVGVYSGSAAAGASFIHTLQSVSYQLNNCALQSLNCVLLSPLVVPVVDPAKDYFVGTVRRRHDDDDALPNVGEEDY